VDPRRDVGTPGTRLFEGQDRRIVSVNCQRQISHNATSWEFGLPTSAERAFIGYLAENTDRLE
jgi:hypothetical protein